MISGKQKKTPTENNINPNHEWQLRKNVMVRMNMNLQC